MQRDLGPRGITLNLSLRNIITVKRDQILSSLRERSRIRTPALFSSSFISANDYRKGAREREREKGLSSFARRKIPWPYIYARASESRRNSTACVSPADCEYKRSNYRSRVLYFRGGAQLLYIYIHTYPSPGERGNQSTKASKRARFSEFGIICAHVGDRENRSRTRGRSYTPF